MNHFKSTGRAILLALLATALLLVFRRFVFVPLFGFNPPFMLSVFAVTLAAWLGGFQSGVIATLLNVGLLWAHYSVQEGVAVISATRQLRLLMFVVNCGLISWGLEVLRAAGRRNKHREQELVQEMQLRKQAETDLREREERIRLAVESANIGTWDFNPVTGEQQWSARAKIMFGLSPDADLGQVSFRDRVHPEDRDRVNQAIRKAFDPSGDGAYEIDCRLLWPDGSVHWFIAKGQALFEGELPNRRAIRFIGTVVDITERKQAEQALSQAEERFRSLATHAPVGIFQADRQGRCLFVNEAWCAIVGATVEEALGQGWVSFLHSEDRQRIINEWQAITSQRRDHVTEFRFANPRTGTRWVAASATALVDASGRLTGYVGTTVDLTERKAIEDAVRVSEMHLRGILDNTPAVISLKDLAGRYVLVNRGWEVLFDVRNDQIVGLTNEELLSMTSSRHMSRKIVEQFLEIDRTVIQSGEPVEFEDPMPHEDDPRVFVTVKFPIKDRNGKITGVGGISIDITERRKAIDSLEAEQELLRHTIEVQDQERQLVAYEIHDGLVQYATGALMQLESTREHVKSEALARQIENVVNILRKTVNEGRRIINGIHTTILDDCGVVAAIQQLIEDEDRAHVQIDFVHDESPGRIASNIELALYHITREALTNAFKHSKSKRVRIELARQGDRVHLIVRDWGVGFTPPASSMEVHGLRGMTERARIAGGICKVGNAPGGGTQVTVDLPYLARPKTAGTLRSDVASKAALTE